MEQGEPGKAGNDENCLNPDIFTLTSKWINREALLGEGWDHRCHSKKWTRNAHSKSFRSSSTRNISSKCSEKPQLEKQGRQDLADNIITDYYIHHMFWNKAQWFCKRIRSLQLHKEFLFSLGLPEKLITKAPGSPAIPRKFHKPKFCFNSESTLQRTLLFSPNKFTFVVNFLSILLLP